jgi:hypothetical protein
MLNDNPSSHKKATRIGEGIMENQDRKYVEHYPLTMKSASFCSPFILLSIASWPFLLLHASMSLETAKFAPSTSKVISPEP